MRSRLLAAGLLAPTAVALSALPASAATPRHSDLIRTDIIRSTAVAGTTASGASPIHRVRSSSVACSGTLYYSGQATLKGKVVGQLYVYMRSADGGQAIACFKHAGITKGKRAVTSVAVAAAKKYDAQKPDALVVAYGNFSSYAGPAAVGGIKGSYVQAAGAVVVGKQQVTIESPVLLLPAHPVVPVKH